MSCPRLRFAAALVVAGIGSTAPAQETVPGGWGSEVNFQSFHAPGEPAVVGGFGAVGTLSGVPGGLSFPTGGVGAGRYAGQPDPAVQSPPQTVNTLGFLGNTVRKSVRKRPRR